MGAICLQEHSERLQSLVNDALDTGAEIIARGSFGHIGEGAVDQFFPPTVLGNVKHTMNLMQEEVVKSLSFVSTCRLQQNSLKKDFICLSYIYYSIMKFKVNEFYMLMILYTSF